MLNSEDSDKFRNIAIIAHVDHGKTTLVDALLSQSGCAVNNERAMDSIDLEQEKGITILSKCTSILYKNHKINIVDTPGHHDFGGEVERIMDMVDGVILVVCATEGPMPQTKFVLQKALKQNLKPIVVINKVDRPTSRVKEVEDEIFDLFCSLEVSDEVLDYQVFYCSAKEGYVLRDVKDEKKNVFPLLDGTIELIPSPKVDINKNFTMLISQTESNKFYGKMLIGKVYSGSIKVSDKVLAIDAEGAFKEQGKIFKIIRRFGMNQVEIQRAIAGDIVSIAGFSQAAVTDTLNLPGNFNPIKSIPIDPPMISIKILVNNSPLAGKDGNKISFGDIKERLIRESENDVALKIKLEKNEICVSGRGDLHLGVLIEKLRREGYELAVTPPTVVYKMSKKNKKMEPIEKVFITVAPEFSAKVIEELNNRNGEYVNFTEVSNDLQMLEFNVPTRTLLGFRADLLNFTKGTGIVHTTFHKYEEHKGELSKKPKGAIIALHDGVSTAYGIKNIEKFGEIFVSPGKRVYTGMVIGEHIKSNDVELNPAKEKKLNNIRVSGSEEQIRLANPRVFSLEEAICYIKDDEIIEVTPKEIRIRKLELLSTDRKRINRNKKNQ